MMFIEPNEEGILISRRLFFKKATLEYFRKELIDFETTLVNLSLVTKQTQSVMKIFILAIAILVASCEKENIMLGTWDYSAPGAPYEYQVGQMIFSESGDGMEAFMQIGSNKMQAKELVIKENTASFYVWIESNQIKITLKFDEEKFKGTASYSEGVLELTGKKKPL